MISVDPPVFWRQQCSYLAHDLIGILLEILIAGISIYWRQCERSAEIHNNHWTFQ